MTLDYLTNLIMQDESNKHYTNQGMIPLFHLPVQAKLLLIGQAPGIHAQQTRLFFNDASGDTLREWMGISRELFYESNQIAVLPMDFYYPGKNKRGDLPPRKDFAKKWHPMMMDYLNHCELTILIGKYAQDYYLSHRNKINLTETVKHYQEYLPTYFPIVHPSPRNNIWHAKNPWFKEQVVPHLQKIVEEILYK